MSHTSIDASVSWRNSTHDACTPAAPPKPGRSPIDCVVGPVAAADEHRVAGLRRHALRGGGVGELPSVHRCAGRDVLGPAQSRDVVEHPAGDDPLAPEVDGAAVRLRHAVLVEPLPVPRLVPLLHREVAERVEMGLGEPVDEQRQVVAHRARVLHRHHVARRVRVRRTRLGVDGPGARDHAPVLHQRGGGAPHVVGHEVEGAELVVVAPTPPVGVVGAPAVVLVGGGWCAVLDAHAQTVTPRLRSPLVTVDGGYDPFSVEVMTDPYPVYRELRARHRVVPLARVRRVRAHPVRRRVARAHRSRPVLDLRGSGVPPRGAPASPRRSARHQRRRLRCPRSPCSTRRCTRSCARRCSGPFRPRAVVPMEDTVRQFARERLDQLVEQRRVRRAPRLRVAGGGAGRRAAARVPGRGRRAARRSG